MGAKTECKTECKEEQKMKSLSYCLLSGEEKAMKREIFNRGPVVAPVFVQDDFLVYEGGIYTPTRYSRAQSGADDNSMFAAVTVLGWGKSEGTKYWIVSNSWGTGWGEKGYARVAIDSIVREGQAVVATPATEENIAEKERKEAEAAARDAADLTDLDSDDLDDDIEDLDEDGGADGEESKDDM